MGDLIWRMLYGLFRRLGWGVMVTLGLLLALAITAMLGIRSVLQDIQTDSLVPFVLAALLATWVLHSLRLPDWLAGLMLIGGGSLGVLASTGRLGQPTWYLLKSLGAIRLLQIEELGWRLEVSAPLDAWLTLVNAAQGLSARLSAWLNGMIGANAVYDPLAAEIVWSLSTWLLIAWMGWWVLRRKNVILGLAPLLGLLAWALYFTHARVHLLILGLAIGCTLHILTLHLKNTARWQDASLEPPDNLLTLSIVTTLVAAGLALTALAVTSFSLVRFQQVVREWFQPQEPLVQLSESIGEALGLQGQAQVNRYFGNAWRPTLPSQHLLIGEPQLSETVFMWVTLEGYPAVPQAAASAVPEPPQFYWRSLAYNRYSGSGWYSDATVTTAYSAGELLDGDGEGNITLKPSERLIRQQFHIFRPAGGVIYYTGELLMVDQGYEVAWRRTAAPGDVLGAIVQENSYQVISREMDVDNNSLRQAGSSYPNWVMDRYLSLPERTPRRVLDLALDLTATQPTPFDRALALETYLRSTYTYTLELPPPPLERDLVDYFLFDLKQGYCDYFASAMVVMARAAGLPARLVTGFLGGTWDAQAGRMIVTEAEAHSWAEIYFPEYGWITFEATAGRPALERLDQPASEPSDSAELLTVKTPWDFRDWTSRIGLVVQQTWVWLLLAAGGLIYLFTHLDGWLLRWHPPRQTVTRVYQRIFRQALHLGVSPGPGGTLREFSQRLTQTLGRLASTGLWQYEIERLADDVNGLSALYEQALFSQHDLERTDQRHCIKTWQRMRVRFWLARFRMRFFAS